MKEKSQKRRGLKSINSIAHATTLPLTIPEPSPDTVAMKAHIGIPGV
jgi:hypothetical protein